MWEIFMWELTHQLFYQNYLIEPVFVYLECYDMDYTTFLLIKTS